MTWGSARRGFQTCLTTEATEFAEECGIFFSMISVFSVVDLLFWFNQNSSFNANWISRGSRALETWPRVGPSVIFPSGT